jgi:hypothetical protein
MLLIFQISRNKQIIFILSSLHNFKAISIDLCNYSETVINMSSFFGEDRSLAMFNSNELSLLEVVLLAGFSEVVLRLHKVLTTH